jgi:hypothetical protein
VTAPSATVATELDLDGRRVPAPAAVFVAGSLARAGIATSRRRLCLSDVDVAALLPGPVALAAHGTGAAPAVAAWSAVAGPRTLLLAAPRSHGASAQGDTTVLVGHPGHPDAHGSGEDALLSIASDADLVLVVRSADSSHSRRLADLAARRGTRAELVDDVSHVRPEWLAGTRTIGLAAGASGLLDELVHALGGLGPVTVGRTTTLVS